MTWQRHFGTLRIASGKNEAWRNGNGRASRVAAPIAFSCSPAQCLALPEAWPRVRPGGGASPVEGGRFGGFSPAWCGPRLLVRE